jgi:hypothetical protein
MVVVRAVSLGTASGGQPRRRRKKRRRQAGGQAAKTLADDAMEAAAEVRVGEDGEQGGALVWEEEEEWEADGCAICLASLDEGAETLACGHSLHEFCMSAWASSCQRKGIELSCPICRSSL